MTQTNRLIIRDDGRPAHNIIVTDEKRHESWLNRQSETVRSLLAAQNFRARAHQSAILPGKSADDWQVLAGVASADRLKCWCLAKIAETLPAGDYRIAGLAGAENDGQLQTLAGLQQAMLGWALGQYQFTRYKAAENTCAGRILLVPETVDCNRSVLEAEATALVRDMVNCGPEDMGPAQLEEIVRDIADENGAQVKVTNGDELEQECPMIHAVGRAADERHSPRLIELHWGDETHPRIALVGKGVCFDSGGLDIKSAAGMRLMKKDMGGAAHVIALAALVMKMNLPVRLHLLVGAVENAISGHAFRPGDVLKSRKGLSVEIHNTDAEGRLVLGDCLTLADEAKPDLIVDFATLTGAARVALGPDLPPVYASDPDLARSIVQSGNKVQDPLWHLPLWSDYEEYLASDIADICNSGSSFAGSITAGLFLKKFVGSDTNWAHLDVYAWRPSARPGQPKGGEALGLRAVFDYLYSHYGNTTD